MTTSLSRNQFAELLKVSPGTITNWMDGGMPAQRTGRQRQVVRIHLAKALPWVVAHRETKGGERERLAKEQADKFAIENARKRGEIIYADQVAETLAKLGAELAARHDAVPGRVAGELAGLTDPATIRQRLLDELRAVRGAFADAIAELADAFGTTEDDGGHSEAAPEPDAKPVGRPKPRTASRKRRARAVSE